MNLEVALRSPDVYPLTVDLQRDALLLIDRTRQDYGASFLDMRMLDGPPTGTWVPWAAAQRAAAPLPRRCHFIFHISHVGSTLLSRLLDLHPAFFSVREPQLLRNLADLYLALGQPDAPWSPDAFAARLDALLALWSRTYDPARTAVVKATSFASVMARELLARVPGARAVFMHVTPPVFLPALLGGAMSDIQETAGRRLLRLHRRLGEAVWQADRLSPGEAVAMSWLSEVASLHDADAAHPGRALWLDFDAFLADPAPHLAGALSHLGQPTDPAAVAALLASPVMGEYAKKPGQRFDTATRRALLDDATAAHGAEIQRGLDWLRRAAQFPALAPVLAAAARRAAQGAAPAAG